MNGPRQAITGIVIVAAAVAAFVYFDLDRVALDLLDGDGGGIFQPVTAPPTADVTGPPTTVDEEAAPAVEIPILTPRTAPAGRIVVEESKQRAGKDIPDAAKIIEQMGRKPASEEKPTQSQEAQLREQAVQQWFAGLDRGRIAYNPPPTMTVGVPTQVSVRVAPGTEIDVLEGVTEPETFTQRDLPRVATRMTVALCCGPPDADHAFDIVARTSEEQLVAPGEVTVWEFAVTPAASGTHVLSLTVGIVLRDPELGTTRKETVFRDDITVRANPVYTVSKFVRENPTQTIAILGAVCAAIGIPPLLQWRRRRKAVEDEDGNAGGTDSGAGAASGDEGDPDSGQSSGSPPQPPAP